MQVHLTLISKNKKTGPIPVSTTSADSCPDACPFRDFITYDGTMLRGSCYAKGGPVAILWRNVTNGTAGTDWATFCDKIRALPANQLWRHDQAGDMPGDRIQLDADKAAQLVDANRGKRGFTFSHYDPFDAHNRAVLAHANANGFTINLSANNPAHADMLAELGIGPVAVVLPVDQLTNTTTPAGRKIVICPAVTRDDTSCATCGLCAIATRKAIIGFPAHGASKRRAESASLAAM